jgi:Right handed beta helix region
MNGVLADSYVEGNSIHDTYARGISFRGVHHLKVTKNVLYNIFGHAVVLEDGSETNNVFEKNIVIGSKTTWNLYQTDISVASFLITNPYNYFRNNVAAGSDYYGFLF